MIITFYLYICRNYITGGFEPEKLVFSNRFNGPVNIKIVFCNRKGFVLK